MDELFNAQRFVLANVSRMPRNHLCRGMGAGDHGRRIVGHQAQTQEDEVPIIALTAVAAISLRKDLSAYHPQAPCWIFHMWKSAG